MSYSLPSSTHQYPSRKLPILRSFAWLGSYAVANDGGVYAMGRPMSLPCKQDRRAHLPAVSFLRSVLLVEFRSGFAAGPVEGPAVAASSPSPEQSTNMRALTVISVSVVDCQQTAEWIASPSMMASVACVFMMTSRLGSRVAKS